MQASRQPRVGMPNSQYQRAVSRDSDSERITYFISDITVASDGTLTVHETIRLVAGDTIRHGIYRDIPILGHDRSGARRRLRPEIVSVKRDGRDEPYEFEMRQRDWRIMIGDNNVLIRQGPHVYDIVYRTNRQVGFYDAYDELYWNATGAWRFPIEQAVAAIQWPVRARITGFAGFTGTRGSTASRFVVEHPSETRIAFRATAAFRRGEQMTVAADVAKGAVIQPQGLDAVADFVHENQDVGAVLVGLILLGAYYYIVWMIVGRDPDAGPVAPLYTPPRDLSPAAMRYLMRMGYDRKAFAATLISLAVKGYLRVDDEPDLLQHTFTLVRQDGADDLSSLEAGVLDALFAGEHTLRLTQDNQPRIAGAITALKNALHGEFDTAFFVDNRGWFFGGIAIVVLSAAGAAVLSGAPSDTFMIFQMSSFVGLIGAQFGLRAWRHWAATFARHGARVLEFVRALWWSLATLPCIAAIVFFMFFMSDGIAPETIVALMADGFVAYFFYHLLKAPTAAGAKLRNEIEGFRMFLMTTEKEQLKAAHPANLTARSFEKYLPYAVALDAETGWSRRFESDLALAATMKLESNNTAFNPRWYSSNTAWNSDAVDFSSMLGGALGNAAASASYASAFAGGGGGGIGGGGGSAGGGSGGGGGGGW